MNTAEISLAGKIDIIDTKIPQEASRQDIIRHTRAEICGDIFTEFLTGMQYNDMKYIMEYLDKLATDTQKAVTKYSDTENVS